MDVSLTGGTKADGSAQCQVLKLERPAGDPLRDVVDL